MQKNTAGQKIHFGLIDASDGSALTGATVTVYLSIDGGTQAEAAGSVTELGNGLYVFAPAQADTNGNTLGFAFTADDAIPVFAHFETVDHPRDAIPNATAGSAGGLPVLATGAKLTAVQLDGEQPEYAPLKPTTAGRTLDVSEGGEAGIDWSNIGGATTTVNLSGTTVKTATDIATQLNSMAGSGFDTSTDSLEAIRNRGDEAWLTATGFSTHSASDVATAILVTPANKLATDASGQVTVGAVDESVEVNAAIDAGGITEESFDQSAQNLIEALVAAAIGDAGVPTAADIADAVWDEGANTHTTAGSMGQAMNAQSAVLYGTISTADTNSEAFARDVTVTFSVDTDGNRSNVVIS